MTTYQAAVIGGGFFGCAVATYLAQERGFERVLIIEKEQTLFARASSHNQARVHGGYHYPRDHLTARRSRITRDWFKKKFSEAIEEDITSIYALAANGSNVNAAMFVKRMARAGAKLSEPSDAVKALFSRERVDSVFQVDEEVFNATRLRELVQDELNRLEIRVELGSEAVGLDNYGSEIAVQVDSDGGDIQSVLAEYVFNCTYAGLNSVDKGRRPLLTEQIKHEVAELFFVAVPPQIEGLAITVMDGPFFSLMPFPPSNSYTISHVRYTPRHSWIDEPSIDPYVQLERLKSDSRGERILRDAAQFVPSLRDCSITGSFQEVKTVLARNESNDGRPILVERSDRFPGLVSILGGKIDNVFDVLEFLSKESFGQKK